MNPSTAVYNFLRTDPSDNSGVRLHPPCCSISRFCGLQAPSWPGAVSVVFFVWPLALGRSLVRDLEVMYIPAIRGRAATSLVMITRGDVA